MTVRSQVRSFTFASASFRKGAARAAGALALGLGLTVVLDATRPATAGAGQACGSHASGNSWTESTCPAGAEGGNQYRCVDGVLSIYASSCGIPGCGTHPNGTQWYSNDCQGSSGAGTVYYCSGGVPTVSGHSGCRSFACAGHAEGSTWTASTCPEGSSGTRSYRCRNGQIEETDFRAGDSTPSGCHANCGAHKHGETWTEATACPAGTTGAVTYRCEDHRLVPVGSTCKSSGRCTPTTETRWLNCPTGLVGVHTQERTYSCAANNIGTWGAWTDAKNTCGPPVTCGAGSGVSWGDLRCSATLGSSAAPLDLGGTARVTDPRGAAYGTATVECVGPNRLTVQPGATCQVPCATQAPERRTLACPGGQSGTYTQERHHRCAAGSGVWSDWATVENRCTTGPSVCTPGFETKNVGCLAWQEGTHVQRRDYTCSPSGVRQYTREWVDVTNTCKDGCTPRSESRTLACPAGTVGTVIQRNDYVCEGSGGRAMGHWSGWHDASRSCTTQPQCTRTARPPSTGPCPAGFTGTVTNEEYRCTAPTPDGRVRSYTEVKSTSTCRLTGR